MITEIDKEELKQIAKDLDNWLNRVTIGNDEFFDLLSTAYTNMDTVINQS